MIAKGTMREDGVTVISKPERVMNPSHHKAGVAAANARLAECSAAIRKSQGRPDKIVWPSCAKAAIKECAKLHYED